MKVTTFKNPFARDGETEEFDYSWDKLTATLRNPPTYLDKGACPLLKLATFNGRLTAKGSVRHNKGVETVTGLEGDYDSEQLSLADAETLLSKAGIKCFLYTSPSHTPETPRWRILVPLKTPLEGSTNTLDKKRKALLHRIDDILGGKMLANESYTLSQAYYYGAVQGVHYSTVTVPGSYIDEAKVIPFDNHVNLSPTTGYGPGLDIEECIELIHNEENYHQSTLRLAAHYVGKGEDRASVIHLLQEIYDISPNQGPKWEARRDAIIEAVDTALAQFGPEDAGHLVDRYALVTGIKAIYFDLKTKHMLSKSGIDSKYRHLHSGKKNDPLASNVIDGSEDKQEASGFMWHPLKYGDQENFIEHRGMRYANTWAGYPLSPVRGDVQPWLKLAHDLFAADPGVAEHIIKHMAFCVQHPDVKCNWAPVITGLEGAGKDALYTPLAQIFGDAAKTIDNRDLKGGFDDGLAETKFVSYSEARGVSDDALEKLKRIVASESNAHFKLNPKMKEQISQVNLWHVVIITNHMDAVKMSPTERRFYVVNTGDYVMEQAGDTAAYFDWLKKDGQINNDAVAAVFDYLLHLDLADFNPNNIPERTRYMEEMINLTQTDLESVIDDLVVNGQGCLAEAAMHPKWLRGDIIQSNPALYQVKESEVKKILLKKGWVIPATRVQKTVDGKTQKKSRGFIFNPEAFEGKYPKSFHEMSGSDLFNIILSLEKLNSTMGMLENG